MGSTIREQTGNHRRIPSDPSDGYGWFSKSGMPPELHRSLELGRR